MLYDFKSFLRNSLIGPNFHRVAPSKSSKFPSSSSTSALHWEYASSIICSNSLSPPKGPTKSILELISSSLNSLPFHTTSQCPDGSSTKSQFTWFLSKRVQHIASNWHSFGFFSGSTSWPSTHNSDGAAVRSKQQFAGLPSDIQFWLN